VSLTAADVEEIMRLVEGSSFDELTLEVDGLKLCLRRGDRPDFPAGKLSEDPVVLGRLDAVVPPPPLPAGAQPAEVDPNVAVVLAPLLGTFYSAPKPGAPPFVEVGSLVEEDTVVAIIEVMKLMNSVRAGVRGRVSEILVADGVLVEFGQTLFRVEAQ
jgi:acetyl-CoA carboxylase biotin carboxyl carrier protein